MPPSSNPSSNSDPHTYLTLQELTQWQAALAEADRHNIFCHCHSCGYEWVSSQRIPEHPQITERSRVTERSRSAECPQCSGRKIESIACWQFPDD